jgi:hypothetical protein
MHFLLRTNRSRKSKKLESDKYLSKLFKGLWYLLSSSVLVFYLQLSLKTELRSTTVVDIVTIITNQKIPEIYPILLNETLTLL